MNLIIDELSADVPEQSTPLTFPLKQRSLLILVCILDDQSVLVH